MVIFISSITSFHTSPKEVESYLKETKEIINSESFCVETDFFLINKTKNTQTLLNLDFDADDVINVISNLNIEDYSETLMDIDNQNPPLLYVFGNIIQNKEIYIKIKTRTTPEKKIICVSFHLAEHKMQYPYKK